MIRRKRNTYKMKIILWILFPYIRKLNLIHQYPSRRVRTAQNLLNSRLYTAFLTKHQSNLTKNLRLVTKSRQILNAPRNTILKNPRRTPPRKKLTAPAVARKKARIIIILNNQRKNFALSICKTLPQFRINLATKN